MKMREIIFRGKWALDDVWLYGYLDKDYIGNLRIDGDVVKAKTVGQYTGIRDKNGTRIFEGDILRDPECTPGRYYVVVFCGAGFEIQTQDKGLCLPGMLKDEYHYLTITSNIHEEDK
jgi:uncharacterized phage protein (TIGR01671 family)